ncbi:cupin domain-containing protein [Bacillus sp. REN16]|uniref:cupin domain-containing protein n=1 Tax=Bacillus sp. REN16 TaxID=2887296 RepID=UPI001E64C5A7|nr:cupin domain-containing protein [Bacillus sp. REN16]MCC3358789.1 cupin domain-containing protein [Bacillus sp. REN16]
MNEKDAQFYITHLGLEPHPEGGYYNQIFASDIMVNTEQDKQRKLYTSIYFLLGSKDISHLHRIQSDELWYYHGGSSLTVHIIDELGEYKELKLGLNLESGEVPQVIVPKNSIFGSSVKEENTFSLVGCMVAPGFEFEDFELFTQEELLKDYPQHEGVIRKLALEKK